MGAPRKFDWNREQLMQWYGDEGLSTIDIAKILGCDHRSVNVWMQKFGIPRRSSSNAAFAAVRQNKIHSGVKENESRWNGGRWVDARGYVYIYKPDYHRVTRKVYIQEHIFIWEQVHNRHLPKGWVIHHLNGIKGDNRPENLVAMRSGEHISQVEPYKKRIRELEAKVALLERALRDSQLIFGIGEN